MAEGIEATQDSPRSSANRHSRPVQKELAHTPACRAPSGHLPQEPAIKAEHLRTRTQRNIPTMEKRNNPKSQKQNKGTGSQAALRPLQKWANRVSGKRRSSCSRTTFESILVIVAKKASGGRSLRETRFDTRSSKAREQRQRRRELRAARVSAAGSQGEYQRKRLHQPAALKYTSSQTTP